MPEPRVVNGVRILTIEQIRELSPHGFKAYRSKVLFCRWQMHQNFKPFMGDEPVLTEKHVHDIRTLDWLCHEVNRERDRRKDTNEA